MASVLSIRLRVALLIQFLPTTGCPHSQLLGVNGLVSPSNRLLLLGIYNHLIKLSLTQLCLGLNANESQIPYDKHHKVLSLVNYIILEGSVI